MSHDLIAQASATINAPVARVWDALVNPAVIKRYMFGTNVQSDWHPGSTIVWKGEWKGKPYQDTGRILEMVPSKKLRYSHFSPLSGLPDAPENYHYVTIELSGDDGDVHVALAQDHNASEKARAHSAESWSAMLGSLKKVLETPSA